MDQRDIEEYRKEYNSLMADKIRRLGYSPHIAKIDLDREIYVLQRFMEDVLKRLDYVYGRLNDLSTQLEQIDRRTAGSVVIG